MGDVQKPDLYRDCRGAPWATVRALEHCGACLGALPADFSSACRVCGGGASGDGGGAIYPQAVERARLAVNPWARFRARTVTGG